MRRSGPNFLRIFVTLALIIVLRISGASALTPADDSDLYVLTYGGADGYPYDQNSMVASPYISYLKVDTDGDGVTDENWNWTGMKTMNLVNTLAIADGGSGAYASFETYCLDAITNSVDGHVYRRVNLEDSPYFDTTTAERLRAIFTNSYPYTTDMEGLAAKINAWQKASRTDYTDVAYLTIPECITATQAAIWVLTNNVTVEEVYYYTDPDRFNDPSYSFVDDSYMDNPATPYTANNIQALFDFLLALDGIEPLDPLVSADSFLTTSADYYLQSDGRYNLVVKATVDAQNVHDDTMRLHASAGGRSSTSFLLRNGTNEYTLTVYDVESPNAPVTLIAEGMQSAADVFLFLAEDGYAASQSQACFSVSNLPNRVRSGVRDVDVHDDQTYDDLFDPTAPDTGDGMNLALWLGLLGSGVVGLVRLRRRGRSF